MPGEVAICGFDLARKRSQAAECVGFAAGYLPLTERMRVSEYLQLYGQLYGLADPTDRIKDGLERFRISHLAEAMGTELSSGQRTLIGTRHCLITLSAPALAQARSANPYTIVVLRLRALRRPATPRCDQGHLAGDPR